MNLKVVIVDDDEVVIFLHTLMVKKTDLSFCPLSFLSGKETLDYLIEQHQEGNRYLILLDINMPNMNGWEFLDKIQALPFSNMVSVVMVTSSIDGKDKEMAKRYEQVVDFVEKPLEFDICNQIKRLPQLAHFFL